MNDYRYLIDSNVLSRLTPNQRGSEIFRKRCRVPSEVIYEARGYIDETELSTVEYSTTGNVLSILREVMATVKAEDTSLVDLYANKGNADPLIIACALDAKREVDKLLFGPTWVIVSDDRAVRSKAAEFGIATKSSEEFAAIVAGQKCAEPKAAV